MYSLSVRQIGYGVRLLENGAYLEKNIPGLSMKKVFECFYVWVDIKNERKCF